MTFFIKSCIYQHLIKQIKIFNCSKNKYMFKNYY